MISDQGLSEDTWHDLWECGGYLYGDLYDDGDQLSGWGSSANQQRCREYMKIWGSSENDKPERKNPTMVPRKSLVT